MGEYLGVMEAEVKVCICELENICLYCDVFFNDYLQDMNLDFFVELLVVKV